MLKEQLEQDIRQFFNDIDGMLPEGKNKALMNLFDKYMHLSTTPILFGKQDYDKIRSNGVSLYNDRSWPKKFNNSYSEISTSEAPQMCWIEATIAYLNGKDCLKKTPKFDYRED